MLLFTQIRLPILRQLLDFHKTATSLYLFHSFNKGFPWKSFHSHPFYKSGNLVATVINRSNAAYCTVTEGILQNKLSGSHVESQKERIAEIEEYFKHYTEEYYEVENDEAIEGIKKDHVLYPVSLLSKERGCGSIFDIDELIHILREERANDIACIEVPVSVGTCRYIIICCPHNYRHAQALVQTVRKCYKIRRSEEDEILRKPSKYAAGWYCFYVQDIVLHVMTPEAREKYKLEILWGVGEDIKEDDDEVLTF